MNYMRVIYKYYPTPFLFYSLRSGMSSSQLISNYSRSLQIKTNVSVVIEKFDLISQQSKTCKLSVFADDDVVLHHELFGLKIKSHK